MVEDIFIKITPGTRSVAMPRSAARKDFRRENDTVLFLISLGELSVFLQNNVQVFMN